jgi:hypothetical protein
LNCCNATTCNLHLIHQSNILSIALQSLVIPDLPIFYQVPFLFEQEHHVHLAKHLLNAVYEMPCFLKLCLIVHNLAFPYNLLFSFLHTFYNKKKTQMLQKKNSKNCQVLVLIMYKYLQVHFHLQFLPMITNCYSNIFKLKTNYNEISIE